MKNVISNSVRNEIKEITWNKEEIKKTPLSDNAKVNVILLSMTALLILSVSLINLFF